MQSLATSQKKSDKVWNSAEVVYSSADLQKIDFVCLCANDGLYVVSKDTDQTASTFLKNPLVSNNDEKYSVSGLIRNIYIPYSYDSENPEIIFQTASNVLWGKSGFYKLNLSDIDNPSIQKLENTLENDGYKFVSRSKVEGSSLLLFTNLTSPYTYTLGRYDISDGKLAVRAFKTFESAYKFDSFWENSEKVDSLKALVLTSTSGDEDIKDLEYYSLNLSNSQITYQKGISDITIRLFVVFDDATFMGITQSGSIVHSSSLNKHLYSSDSSYSYNRYTPSAVFKRFDYKAEEAEPDYTIFSRYNGNGFIIYSYNKELDSNNKIYNSDYKGHVQTTGFAENLRSEDISELFPVILSENTSDRFRIIVLTTENGIATFRFDSTIPSLMKTNGTEIRDRLDVFE